MKWTLACAAAAALGVPAAEAKPVEDAKAPASAAGAPDSKTKPEPTAKTKGAPSFAPDDLDDPCRQSRGCRRFGTCTTVEGKCKASSDADCAFSEHCDLKGSCWAREGACVAATQRECQRSKICRKDGHCFINREQHRCDTGMERRSRAMMGVGIALLPIGAIAMIASLPFRPTPGETIDGIERRRLERISGLLLAGGGLTVLGSVVMIYIGGELERRPDALPDLSLSPTGGELQWRF